jgi:Trk K+ transport system NAD-binding subunit
MYAIAPDSKAIGKTLGELDKVLSDASVEAVYRNGKIVEMASGPTVQAGDHLALTGSPTGLDRVQSKIGYKITAGAAIFKRIPT